METKATEQDQTSELRTIQHEVNNALTAIFGHAQLLLLRGQLDDKARERVLKIDELAHQIRHTINKLTN